MPRTLASRASEIALNLLRIVAGLLFAQHGAQKLLGLFGGIDDVGGTAAFGTLPWFAGVIELFGGLLVAVGLFTRPATFIMSGEMAFAYFLSHAPRAFWPILNRGELAALYCFLFLYFAAHGAGSFSLDGLIHRQPRQAPRSRPR
jgi:putative oxidoreductase